MAPLLPSLFSKSGYGVTLGFFFLYNLPVNRELKTSETGKMAELAPGMSWKAPLSLLLSWSSSTTLVLANMSFMDSGLFY